MTLGSGWSVIGDVYGGYGFAIVCSLGHWYYKWFLLRKHVCLAFRWINKAFLDVVREEYPVYYVCWSSAVIFHFSVTST